MRTDDQFQSQVIQATQEGDGVNMPSPFGLQSEGNILVPDKKVQIYISTPKNDAGTDLKYKNRVDAIIEMLTGNNGPYRGVQVVTRGYKNPTLDERVQNENRHTLDYSVRGKVVVEYDNDQKAPEGEPPYAKQQSIWRLWLEDQSYEDQWDAPDGSCTLPAAANNGKRDLPSSSGGGCSRLISQFTLSTEPITSPTATSTGMTTSYSASETSQSTSSDVTSTDMPITISSLSLSSQLPFTIRCFPYADPDHSIGNLCECDGLPGRYPELPQPTGGSSDGVYRGCDYTKSPTTAEPSSVSPFTTTETDGEVVVCATSTWENYAANTDPACAGSTTVVSTVMSIASKYFASITASLAAVSASSVSAAVASASSASEAAWSAAAAAPSAGCWIVDDDGFGDILLSVHGINGWAGDDGSKLHKQEDGCGILSGWEWNANGKEDFQGRERATERAIFGLSFCKAGCVERAVHSAGGPIPGGGNG